MKKFVLLSSILLVFALAFSFSNVFATANMENAGQAAKNAINNTVAATKTTTNAAKTNVSNYAATRTSATAPVKVAGMSATGWVWFIMIIFGILLVALLMYYGNHVSTKRTVIDHSQD